MSVSFYQKMYSKAEGNYTPATDAKSTGLYKLNALTQGDYFRAHTKEKYDHEVYDFSTNLTEEGETPPMSTEYLSPDDILKDLVVYQKLVGDLKVELRYPQDEVLVRGLEYWNLDRERLDWIANEITELEKVCLYAKEKGYFIKYVCDY